MFTLHQDRLKIKEKLGKGRFGTVFPYQKHSEDLKWVVRRIKAEDSDALIASLPEVVLGMSCDHPNIVPVKGYFIQKHDDNEGYNIYTKLPRMKGTLLEDFQETKGRNAAYSEEEVIRHFYSLVSGVEYLHKKNIFHGDIKPESLLLDHDGVLKIGDIGVSKRIFAEKAASQPILNYQYSAPELLGVEVQKEMLKKGDIWSLGVVILELCSFDVKLLNTSLPKDQLQMGLNKLLESLQGKYHAKIIEILQMVLSLDPAERPDAELVKRELAKSFPEILSERVGEQQIGISDEQKQEMFGSYEAQIKNLKSLVSQFESELAQKSEMKTPAKPTTGGGEETKTDNFDEQVRRLQEEKSRISHEYNELLVKEREENMKHQEMIKSFEAELLKSQLALKEKPKIERPKRESQGELYKENLQAVVSKLNSKWNRWFKSASFECKVDDKFLQVRTPEKSITDESLSKFSKDIILTLEENYLLNLHGFTFYSSEPLLTDRSVTDFAWMLSHSSLELKHLVIYLTYCKGITDQSLEDLSKSLAVQLPHLTHLRVLFNECPKLTDKSLESLAKIFTNAAPELLSLELSFEGVKGMTDNGFENLAKAVENGLSRDRKIGFIKLIFPRTGVSSQKKEQVKRRFENEFKNINTISIR